MRLDRDRIFWFAAATGLLLRIALFLVASREPERRLYTPDSLDYQRLAVNLIEGHGFSRDSSAPYQPDILRTPAYPALLAVLYLCGGASPALGVFVGVLLSGASIFLAKRAVQTWAPGARIGAVAGALRRDEMKDNCSGDARPDGNNCAPAPIWNNAQGEYHQGGQYGDFDKGFHP